MPKIIEYQREIKDAPEWLKWEPCHEDQATHYIEDLGHVKGIRRFQRIKI